MKNCQKSSIKLNGESLKTESSPKSGNKTEMSTVFIQNCVGAYRQCSRKEKKTKRHKYWKGRGKTMNKKDMILQDYPRNSLRSKKSRDKEQFLKVTEYNIKQTKTNHF